MPNYTRIFAMIAPTACAIVFVLRYAHNVTMGPTNYFARVIP